MASVELRDVEYHRSIDEIAETIQANFQDLIWALRNLDSENVVNINTDETSITSSSEQLEILGDTLVIRNGNGDVAIEISPDGIFVNNLSVTGSVNLRTSNLGTHDHGIPDGSKISIKLPSGQSATATFYEDGVHSHLLIEE
ncbi:MAG: hypothetical protein LBM38_06555 [Clostridiales bacterium]|jgi:hypothetical protein|nr:hypothetical protein [Clostridiales bacterium]